MQCLGRLPFCRPVTITAQLTIPPSTDMVEFPNGTITYQFTYTVKIEILVTIAAYGMQLTWLESHSTFEFTKYQRRSSLSHTLSLSLSLFFSVTLISIRILINIVTFASKKSFFLDSYHRFSFPVMTVYMLLLFLIL